MKPFIRPLIPMTAILLVACTVERQDVAETDGRDGTQQVTSDNGELRATSEETPDGKIRTTLSENASGEVVLTMTWNVGTGRYTLRDPRSGNVVYSQLLQNVSPSHRFEWANDNAIQSHVRGRLTSKAYTCAKTCELKCGSSGWEWGAYFAPTGSCDACDGKCGAAEAE